MKPILQSLIYRTGTIGDKEQLKQLGIAAYGPYAAVLAPEHWAQLNGFLQDDGKLIELIRKSRVFVCLHGEALIGMAFLIPRGNPWDIFDAAWSYLRMVGVHPDYAGRGIARALTQQCIDYARETGEQVVALHTSEFMDAARHLYESLGFKQVKEIAPRLGKRYWLYRLELAKVMICKL